jgi:hypothetical protein
MLEVAATELSTLGMLLDTERDWKIREQGTCYVVAWCDSCYPSISELVR